MLQIIGWLGCAYLVVKALELLSSSTHRNDKGELNNMAAIGAIIAFVSAVVFFFMFNSQASSSPLASSSPGGIMSELSSSYPSGSNVMAVDENLMTDMNATVDDNIMSTDMNATDVNATDGL